MKPVYFADVSIHISDDVYATVDVRGNLQVPFLLTKTKAKILRTILERPGKVCTPSMIAAELYPGKNARTLPGQKIIDIYVCGIRKKLQSSGLPDPITSVWGRGYRFGDPAPAQRSDLIPPELRSFSRWVQRRKVEVLNLITDLESQRAVLSYFSDLSETELYEWRHFYHERGAGALRATYAWQNV